MADVVRVRLADETFALRTEKDPALLHAAAELADARMSELRGNVNNRQTAALLTALALADELLEARRVVHELRERFGEGLDAVLQRLDALDSAVNVVLDAAAVPGLSDLPADAAAVDAATSADGAATASAGVVA